MAKKGNKNALGNKGGGRKTNYKAEYADMAYNIALLGATDVDLARIFEVTEPTINNWKISHPEFFLALKRGKDEADANVASRLYERAMGFEHDSEEIKVIDEQVVRVPIRKQYPPDTTAGIFWLKNRQPAKWRDKVDHELTGKGGEALHPQPDLSKLTDEELTVLADLQRKLGIG